MDFNPIFGTDGNDTIDGTNNNDSIDRGQGDDFLIDGSIPIYRFFNSTTGRIFIPFQQQKQTT